jgi:hypothetical protein
MAKKKSYLNVALTPDTPVVAQQSSGSAVKASLISVWHDIRLPRPCKWDLRSSR